MAIRFEVVINEQEPIVSGFSEEFYVMTANFNAAVFPDKRQDLRLYLGGLVPAEKINTLWMEQPLKAGDKIRIRILEDISVTEPIEKTSNLKCT